jgi:hypothetical protein
MDSPRPWTLQILQAETYREMIDIRFSASTPRYNLGDILNVCEICPLELCDSCAYTLLEYSTDIQAGYFVARHDLWVHTRAIYSTQNIPKASRRRRIHQDYGKNY